VSTHDPIFDRLPISSLTVDVIVQRKLSRIKARRMADRLNFDALGVITVSRRLDGVNAVMDGQHRVEALRIAGYGDGKVQCSIFDGLTIDEEAALFLRLNDTTIVRSRDKARISVIEGEPSAVAMNAMLERYGWHIVAGSSGNCFKAVSTLRCIWDNDVSAAERAIRTISLAWPSAASRGRSDRRIVEGLGLLFIRCGQTVDDDALIGKLSRVTPDSIIAAASSHPAKASLGVARYVVDLYNKGRRTTRLPAY
jgi:hypothetical protein